MSDSLLQRFKDIVSGKVAKQSELVFPIVTKVLANIRELPEDAFIRRYVFANLIAGTSLINILLFDSPKELSIFRKEMKKLREADVEKLFKLMTARYLVVFLQNEDNERLLSSLYRERGEFVQQALALSGFNDHECKTIFLDLWNAYKDSVEVNNPSRFLFHVYRQARYLTLGIPFGATLDPAVEMYFTELRSNSYKNTLFPMLWGRLPT